VILCESLGRFYGGIRNKVNQEKLFYSAPNILVHFRVNSIVVPGNGLSAEEQLTLGAPPNRSQLKLQREMEA